MNANQQALTLGQQPPESAVALIRGIPVTELPNDLYIPPDALEVFLEAFEGGLDLLLYLIKRQNLDVLNIPIAEITRQYMEYVELVKELRLFEELAAEYLVMAAMLAESSRACCCRARECRGRRKRPARRPGATSAGVRALQTSRPEPGYHAPGRARYLSHSGQGTGSTGNQACTSRLTWMI